MKKTEYQQDGLGGGVLSAKLDDLSRSQGTHTEREN